MGNSEYNKKTFKYYLISLNVFAILLAYHFNNVYAGVYLKGGGGITSSFATSKVDYGKLLSEGLRFYPPSAPNKMFFVFLLLLMGIATAVSVVFLLVKQNADAHHVGEEKGRGRLGNDKDRKAFLSRYAEDSMHNLIFSKILKLSLDNQKTQRNSNVLVEGGSGTGKSFCLIDPNIAQLNSTKIITDPSGELFSLFSGWLLSRGKKTMLFDVNTIGRGNYYNPLSFVYNMDGTFNNVKVDKIVDLYMANASEGNANGGSDPFWPKAEKAFLTSLIYYVLECDDIPKRDKCFATILEKAQLAKYEIQEGKKKADETTLTKEINEWETRYIKENGKKPITRRYYDTFLLAPEKTANTILITTAVDLQLFANDQVAEITRTNVEYPELNIDLQTLAEEESYLFLIIPVTNNTYNFLVAMIFSQLYDKLYELGESAYKGKYILYDSDMKPVCKPFESKEEFDNFKAHLSEDNIFPIKYSREIDTYCYVYDGVIWKKNLNREELVKMINEIDTYKLIQKKKNDCRLPVHVQFMMDEMKNIGAIQKFPEMLATCRKYDIGNTIVLQDINQLESLYEKDKDEIVANCDTYIFLGASSEETWERVSKRCGNTTFQQRSVSYDSRGKASYSYAPTEIPILPIHEIKNLNANGKFRCVVIVNGAYPFVEDKYKFTDHPYYEEIMNCDYDASSIFNNHTI